jgi:hypothetical protein
MLTGSFNMKRDSMGHEPDRNDWLGNTLRGSSAASPDACLDAETLAAWADGTLKAQAVTAVEAHASSCARCMAVVAAMERTAPAVRVRHAWTPARLFRWAAPVTAAATAIAIWFLVPNRPATLPVAAPAEESQASGARADADTSTYAERSVPPGTQNAEPPAKDELQLRQESPAPRANRAMEPPANLAAPSAPPEPPPAPAAPMGSPGVASDSLAGTAAARRSMLSESRATSESISVSNPLNRWRVESSTAIERSADGGETWVKTVPLPVVPGRPAGQAIVNVRAVDDLRALATTADGTAFYTTDGGLSWTRVQENSPAPF